jgi:restriction system protein
MTAVWGIHNDALTTELIDSNFVSIGWEKVGDLAAIGSNREALKAAYKAAYPDTKPGSIPVQAGTLHRFAFEIDRGDVIVAPYKPDSTINIGVVDGPYYFDANAPVHPHRRPVRWKKLGLSRSVFTQAALWEIGSAITLFSVKRHAAEFLAVLNAPGDSDEAVSAAVEEAQLEAPEEPADEPRAARVDRFTRDFILERLKFPNISHREFEELTADLLKALGYQARVTPYSQDGGIDVIAHRDPLGVEPPLIKIQCKHQTGTISGPEVQQLVGALAPGELGVFVTLGGYSKDAQSIERQKQGVRLLSGEAVVDLILSGYEQLNERWQTLNPHKRLLVVDDPVLTIESTG